ncbi:MAG TPA: NAD-dependent epimerase/dehydratase family protein [Parapedobacter sp.]|uniref:NAD-dependent epimerase/dehydratase family protein n=1 Tax=Parapedobacter sp. TaxID=1958893 RepID=UPI002BFA45FB|nr:NAD-dependent epimerase/dehydratase family protein [Parapedobacter sp.]HWK58289.1 NAD-dependent epimerase/dehydratase family protein [Parapedobacter sp.]
MRVIITGTTGMIGEGVLIECLAHPLITEVLSVSRKPTGKQHPKLKEYIVGDFLSLEEDDAILKGYDACFYCAGISAVGKVEEEYKRVTYDTTMHFAKVLDPRPNISFIYVSGGGTDGTEKSRMMWARVKGKTENDLAKLPFKQAFGFRIGFVKPAAGQQLVLRAYKYISWLFPVIKSLFPNMYNTMKQVTQAMIHVAQYGYERNVIYVRDIHKMSKQP